MRWGGATVASNRKVLAERFRLTLELHELGVALMRQNLRRRYPRASEATIEERLGRWLVERPGAEQGDAEGRPSRRFPVRR